MRIIDRTRRREAGSAYLAALLAMVVLTIVGLTLAVITDNEMLLGSHERSTTRLIYAADSGINDATARLVTFYNFREKTHTFDEPGTVGIDTEITVRHVLPILTSPCNLCQVNQGSNYSKTNHAVTVVARRVESGGGRQLASTTIAAMVEIQPRESSIPPMDICEGKPGCNPQTELGKIRF